MMRANIRKLRRPLIWAALAMVYAIPFFALNGFGAAYLKFDGINGEATSKGYEDQIPVQSWGFDVNREVLDGSGGGSKLGTLDVAPFSFVHDYDLASPVLALRCFTGKSIPTATLRVNKSVPDGSGGSNLVDYLVVTFTNVLITSLEQAGNGDGDPTSENVKFVSDKVKMEYSTYDAKTGAQGATRWAEWDAAKGIANGG